MSDGISFSGKGIGERKRTALQRRYSRDIGFYRAGKSSVSKKLAKRTERNARRIDLSNFGLPISWIFGERHPSERTRSVSGVAPSRNMKYLKISMR